MELRMPTVDLPWTRKSRLQKAQEELHKVQEGIQKQISKVELPRIGLPTIRRKDIDAVMEETRRATDETRKAVTNGLDQAAAQLAVSANQLGKEAGKLGEEVGKEAGRLGQEVSKEAGRLGQEVSREAGKLGREASREAGKLGHEASREAGKLSKEAAKLAEQAAREARRLSKEAGKRGMSLSRELAATGEDNVRALSTDRRALGDEVRELRIARKQRGPNMMPGIALLAGLGGGLAAMYFLDPEQGRRRRALLRDQLVKWTRITRETAESQARDLRNRTIGAAHEVRRGAEAVEEAGVGAAGQAGEPTAVSQSTPYASADLAATDQAAGVEATGMEPAGETLAGGITVPEGREGQPDLGDTRVDTGEERA
jgi:hypothetical protein